MCGIAGILTRVRVAEPQVRAMADALRHRGPDDAGVWIDADAGIGLGHRRLSIIDLSAAGHQPMPSRCGRYVLTFNGEIYNHADIRRELERSEAIAWRGHSDTETLLEAVARWGLDAALTRSVGMFALGLWDRQTRSLSLARDRIGEKPLYYGWSGDAIVFGSELTALRRAPGFANAVDPDVLALYLRHNYVPAPWSILRHIFKVEPATIVTLDRAALGAPPAEAPRAPLDMPGLSCRRYWSLEALVEAGGDPRLGAEDAIEQLEARLIDAVRLQSVADVPVGAFLSGGVDSSAIVALMRKVVGADVRTFTIGFDQAGFDEAPHAKAVAAHLATDHTELYVTAADSRAIIPALSRIYDEPFADSSQIPTFLVSRLARQAVTVALSGDAGDELFGGYNRYLVSRRVWERTAAVPAVLRDLAGAAIAAVPPGTWDRLGRLPFARRPMLGNKAHKYARMLRTALTNRDIYSASSEEWHGENPVMSPSRLRPAVQESRTNAGSAEEQMMYWDMISYLPDDILAKVDRAAMATSLETRVPFLDHRVVEQAWRTPLAHKIRDGEGKWVLRQILYKHVPRALIERPKAGFAVPVGAWLRGPLRAWADDLLSVDALAREPAFDRDAIRRRWDQHMRGTHDWTGALWSVLMYQAWAQDWAGSS